MENDALARFWFLYEGVQPIKNPTAGWIINALKKLAKEADEVIVATDFDREGELIGAEAVSIMGLSPEIKIKKRASG